MANRRSSLSLAIHPDGSGPGGRPLFRTPDGVAHADIRVGNHRETWAIRSNGFRNYVRRLVFKQSGRPPLDGALARFLAQLEAEAQFGDVEQRVHLRVAEHDGRIYLDLCDAEWRVVEITPNGWRVADDPPIRFCRTPGMLSLPLPERGGRVDDLQSVLNLQSQADFVLIVAWLLAALRGTGPFPVLAIWGEQGSTKSTLLQILRSLVDPNTSPRRSLPRSEQDLFISAAHSFLQTFDNVSGSITHMSDPLCRLATGGGFATRKLFSDSDEVIIDAVRPIILNGITNGIIRPDLAERAISLNLPAIAKSKRRTEREVLAEFEGMRPRILGALLDALSRGIAELHRTSQVDLARMADFDLWARACEPALWPSGSFQRAYATNRKEAVEDMVDADAVSAAIMKMTAEAARWNGTAENLLQRLPDYVDPASDREWPRSPRALRARLDRARTCLRRFNIEIRHTRDQDRNRTRLIEITGPPTRPGKAASPMRPSRASASSAPSRHSNRIATKASRI